MKTLIPLLIFCLVATCNAELRTWTAINGKEVEAEFVANEKGVVKLKLKSGKVFEVPTDKLSKEDNEFISYLAKPEGVNNEELETREDIVYLKGSDTPYTGKAFALYENGQKLGETNYKGGKLDGVTLEWYKKGQKKRETNYKYGKKDGLSIFWLANGQKGSEGIYKDGLTEGIHKMWHANGQMRVQAKFENGIGSANFWNSKGESVNSFEETGLK